MMDETPMDRAIDEATAAGLLREALESGGVMPAKRVYKNRGFAGEMLVAAELARLGFAVTLGNVGTAKTIGVDLNAVDPDTGATAAVSVKALKARNAFLIDPETRAPPRGVRLRHHQRGGTSAGVFRAPGRHAARQ